MLNFFTKNRIKVFFLILLTFAIVKTISPNIFLANTPRVSDKFFTSIMNIPYYTATLTNKLLTKLNKPTLPSAGVKKNITPLNNQNILVKVKQVTPPVNISFESMITGVSAAENPKTGEKYIKINSGTKYRIVGYITLNGVRYPKIEFVE